GEHEALQARREEGGDASHGHRRRESPPGQSPRAVRREGQGQALYGERAERAEGPRDEAARLPGRSLRPAAEPVRRGLSRQEEGRGREGGGEEGKGKSR